MQTRTKQPKTVNWRALLCLLGFAVAGVFAIEYGRLIWLGGLFLPPMELISAALLVMLPLLLATYHATRMKNNERWKRIVTLAGLYFAFAYYLFVLYCFLFAGGRADYDYSYNPINWIPFQMFFVNVANGDSIGSLAYLALDYLKNVALFVPLGFLLPYTSKRMERFGLVMIVSFLLIIAVELTQYWTKTGFFDVDDVISNLLGVACGYGVSRLSITQEVLRFITNTQRRYLGRQRNEPGRDRE